MDRNLTSSPQAIITHSIDNRAPTTQHTIQRNGSISCARHHEDTISQSQYAPVVCEPRPSKSTAAVTRLKTSATMAAKGSTAVGSAQWICAEKENVLDLLQQEQEELMYPAQHEIEWLNEHMAEIFSRNQL